MIFFSFLGSFDEFEAKQKCRYLSVFVYFEEFETTGVKELLILAILYNFEKSQQLRFFSIYAILTNLRQKRS